MFVRTPPTLRMQIVRDLVLIAAADGTLDAPEFIALVNLAGLLGLGPSFVQQIVEEAQVGVGEPAPEPEEAAA